MIDLHDLHSSSCKLLERKKETGVGNELRGKEEGRFAGVERERSSQCRRRPHRVAPPRQSTRPCHRREPPCRRHHEAADLVRVRERSERGGGQRSRRARHCADSSREELVPSPIILAQHQRQNRDLKRARAITTDGEGGASAEKVKSPLSPAPPSRVTAERAVTSAVASLVCSAVVPLRRRPSSHTEQERQRDLRLSWGFNHHAQPCLRRRRRLGWNCRRQKRVQAAANGASRNCSKAPLPESGRRCNLRWLSGCCRTGSETAAVSVQSFLLRFGKRFDLKALLLLFCNLTLRFVTLIAIRLSFSCYMLRLELLRLLRKWRGAEVLADGILIVDLGSRRKGFCDAFGLWFCVSR
ncbi:uncharacterized protein DS421_11g338160 [Arachis hypogaea]|nr:uncharacterized protein DS421_11g338160 [Arachis hypogaea]